MRSSKDARPWVRLDQGFPSNPKVMGLTSDAFRLYITALCWSASNKTDGRIKRPVLLAMGGGKPRTITELVDAGLFDADGAEFGIHDYLEHQESAAQVEKYLAARRHDGSLGGHVRNHINKGVTVATCDHCIAEGRVDVA